MRLSITMVKRALGAVALLASFSVFAQSTFQGMNRVADWTDLETTSNEMPTQIWGTCDATAEDRIGIVVEFSDGTAGSAVYSGVSGLWNTSNFPGINADSATGFLASCTGMHFLHNSDITLPLAWESCPMPFAGNFDLDYNESLGSHFRADTAGWVSARFQTYCGAVAEPVPATAVPAMSVYGLVLLGALLTFAAVVGLTRRAKA